MALNPQTASPQAQFYATGNKSLPTTFLNLLRSEDPLEVLRQRGYETINFLVNSTLGSTQLCSMKVDPSTEVPADQLSKVSSMAHFPVFSPKASTAAVTYCTQPMSTISSLIPPPSKIANIAVIEPQTNYNPIINYPWGKHSSPAFPSNMQAQYAQTGTYVQPHYDLSVITPALRTHCGTEFGPAASLLSCSTTRLPTNFELMSGPTEHHGVWSSNVAHIPLTPPLSAYEARDPARKVLNLMSLDASGQKLLSEMWSLCSYFNKVVTWYEHKKESAWPAILGIPDFEKGHMDKEFPTSAVVSTTLYHVLASGTADRGVGEYVGPKNGTQAHDTTGVDGGKVASVASTKDEGRSNKRAREDQELIEVPNKRRKTDRGRGGHE